MFYLVMMSFAGNCQINEIDTNVVLNKVSRNFLLYRILRAEKHIASFLTKDRYLSSSIDIPFLNYLPDYGCELEISLKEQSNLFPDSNFRVFEVVKNRGLYLCGQIRKDARLYPYDEDMRMLIAVHIKTNHVIFISGNYFLQDIRHYFDFTKGVKVIELYLELRNFMYGIDQVKFKQKRGRKYYFEGRNFEGKLMADIEVKMKGYTIKHITNKLW